MNEKPYTQGNTQWCFVCGRQLALWEPQSLGLLGFPRHTQCPAGHLERIKIQYEEKLKEGWLPNGQRK